MQVKFPQPLPAAAIAKILEGRIEGEGHVPIRGVASPEAAGEGDLTFLLTAVAIERAAASKASAVVAPPGVEIPGKAVIRVENPRYALALALHSLAPKERPPAGIHPSAIVSEEATIEKEVSVGPLAVIGRKVRIGRATSIGAATIIEDDVEIGEDAEIHPNVTIRTGTRIGSRCRIHPGTVIGSDGFGYVQKGAVETGGQDFRRYFQREEPHFKIPQVGNVVIEDDVEIGANVTVDRGTIGPTVLKKGVKVDNLAQIAHNVVIGEHALVISQAGISGSARIGRHATLGGQAGIAEGARIGEGAIIAAQCGIPPGKKVPPGSAFVFSPGRPADQARRIHGAQAVLPKTVVKLRALEREIRELKKSIRSQRPG